MKEQEELWNQEPYVTQSQEVIPKKKKNKTWLFVVLFIALIGIWDGVTTAFLDRYLEEKKEVTKQQEDTSQSREEVIKQQALDHLKERYREEFLIESYRGQGYAYDYINMYAYPTEHQEESYIFKIQGRYDEEGNLQFTDNYVMIKLRDDYEAYVDPIIDEYFDEYKFYMTFDSEWITSNIPADATLEDLWGLKANEDYPMPSLFISISPNEKKEQIIFEELCVKLRDSGLRGRVKIWALKEQERYSLLYRNDWDEYRTSADINDTTTIFLYYDKIERINK